MPDENASNAGADPAGEHTSEPAALRNQVDRASGEASPTRVQTRQRTRSRSRARQTQTDRPEGVILQTQDRAISYVLTIEDGGVLVERTSSRRADLQLTRTFHFVENEDFDRWCASDPMRVEDPHLWSQLIRRGHELLAAAR